MEYFYTAGIQQGICELDEQESLHCIAVLRHRVGDTIQLLDGKGRVYQAQIVQAKKKRCVFELENAQIAQTPNTLSREIHIAIAPTRNPTRFEWFLEKAVELGVSRITPLKTKRGIVKKNKKARWEKILVSAMKQSNRKWLPVLDDLTDIKTLVEEKSNVLKAIAHCEQTEKVLLQDFASRNKALPVQLLIGPEGDFTEDEIETALLSGYKPVSLGEARLRTETAGLSAVVILNSV
jgi:16S rRNA (uracil1498-N3)-methyltransferase